MKKHLILLLSLAFVFNSIHAQDKTKKGWSFGALPAVTYNSDLGLQYGALASVFDYGDGTIYPKYKKMFKIEMSRFTKGSGINQIFFDSEHLFPKKKLRLTADLSYLTDKACDFYGFNGYETVFNPNYSNDQDTDYISRMFYRMERNILRFTCDFQGNIIPGKLRWFAGVGFFNYKIATVDIDKLNKGKDEDKKLPDTALLYDKYVDWGIIKPDEADGGHHQMVKCGLVYDTRDMEANPSKGIWTEIIFLTSPSFLGNNENPFTNLIFIHRQYFTLVKNKLSFVYRLGYQGNLLGYVPFYLQSYMFNS